LLVSIVSVSTQQPTPIWRKPFAAAANLTPREFQIFQVAMEKVPLPPDRGGIDETDIVTVIIQLNYYLIKNRLTLAFLNSRAFTKRTGGPPRSP
jgi:hypothetical protein